METQELKFNTFRATVDSTTTVEGESQYIVELEYYKDRTLQLMEYKTYYEFDDILEIEKYLTNINTQAEIVMMIDEYTTRLGEYEYGVSEDSYLDIATRVLEQFKLK
jgi:hypothetical protein